MIRLPWRKSNPLVQAKLERPLDLLTSGSRDAPARHRALRDTIGWSFELLDDDGQRLFRRLAVFAGGCTLEAAEEVCGGGLDAIGSLVDESLVRSDGERFSLLETIREYAIEQLDASTDAESARRAHAAAYLRLARAAAPGLSGSDQALWRSDVLGMPGVRTEALRAALAAEYVVLSLRGDGPLPAPVERWLEKWMPLAAGRGSKLIALFDHATAQPPAMATARNFLRRAAFAAGVTFFAHLASAPGALAVQPGDGDTERAANRPPRADDPPRRNTPPFTAGHRSTILVVDDYPALCEFISERLRASGHRVLTAHHGEHAQRLVTECGEQIDLLLTDLEMPRMRGDELALWFQRERPGTSVVLMSSAAQPPPALEGLPFLQKPFGVETLLAKVRESLLQPVL